MSDAQVLIEIRAVSDKFSSDIDKALSGVSSKVAQAGKAVESTGRVLTSTLTAGVGLLGVGAYKVAKDYESAFAGVKKTVNATDEEFKKLSDGIRNMAKQTPVEATTIASIVEMGGQLGITNDQLLSFADTVSKLDIATNLSTEQAATEMARFANITGMSQQNFDRLGSTIVALGNNFATTESEIMTMSMRLAAAGHSAGMSEADILGVATALSSLGIQAESGGTAISKLINTMGKDVATNGGKIKEWAHLAGVSVDKFKEKFSKDAAGAFRDVISGMHEFVQKGGNMASLLDDLGIKDAHMIDDVTRLAQSEDILGKAIDQANNAWGENNALTNEAAQRFATHESQLEMLKNKIKDIGISLGTPMLRILNQLIKAVDPVIAKLSEWANSFANMSEAGQNMGLAIAAGAAAIGPLFIGISKVLGVTSRAIEAFSNFTSSIRKDFNQGINQASNSLKSFKKDITTFKTSIADSGGIKGVLEGFSPAHIKRSFSEVIQTFKTAASSLHNEMAKVFFSKLPECFKNFNQTVKSHLSNVRTTVTSGFSNLKTSTVQAVSSLGASISASPVAKGFSAVANTVKSGVSKVASHVSTMGSIFTTMTSSLGSAAQNFSAPFKKLSPVLKSSVSAVHNVGRAFSGIGKSVLASGKALLGFGAISGMMMAGLATLSKTANMSQTSLDQMAQGVSTKLSNLMSNLPGIITAFAGEIPKMISSVASAAPAIFNALSSAFSSLSSTLPQVLAPLMQAGGQIVSGLVSALIAGLPQLISGGMQLFSGLLTAFQQIMPQIISALPGLIGTIVSVIPSLIGMMIQAGMMLFGALVQAIPQVVPVLVAAIPPLVTALVTGIVSLVPMLLQAGIQLFVALAQAIPQVVPQIVSALPQLVLGIINGLVQMIPQLINGAVQFLNAIVQAIPKVLPLIIAAIPVLIVGIVQALLQGIPLLLSGALQLFLTILKAIPQVIVALVQAIPQIIHAIVTGLMGGAGMILDAGKELFGGFVDMITGKKPDAEAAASDLSSSAAQALGTNSTLGAEHGSNLASSFTQGIDLFQGQAQTSGLSLAQNAQSGLGDVSILGMANTSGANIGTNFSAGLDSSSPAAIQSGYGLGEQATLSMGEGGVGAYGQGANLGSQAAYGLSSTAPQMAANAQQGAQNAVTALNNQTQGMFGAGQSMGESAGKGIGSTSQTVSGQATQVGEAAKSALNAFGASGTHFYIVGTHLMESVAYGMAAGIPQVRHSVDVTGREAKTALHNYTSQFQSVGVALMQGLANGVRSGQGSVVAAARAAAMAAYNAAKAALGVHSPSRKFHYLGEMTQAGAEKGVRENADKPVGAIKSTVKQMEKEFASARLKTQLEAALNISKGINNPLPLSYQAQAGQTDNSQTTYSIGSVILPEGDTASQQTISDFISLVQRHANMGVC